MPAAIEMDRDGKHGWATDTWGAGMGIWEAENCGRSGGCMACPTGRKWDMTGAAEDWAREGAPIGNSPWMIGTVWETGSWGGKEK